MRILFIQDCSGVCQTLAGALNRKGHSAFLIKDHLSSRSDIFPTTVSILRKKIIRLKKVDVVNTNEYCSWIIGELLKDLLGISHVIIFHGTDIRELVGRDILPYVSPNPAPSVLKKGILMQPIKRCDLLLATTPDLLVYSRMINKRILYLPQPIDMEVFNDRAMKNESLSGDPIVFCPTPLRTVKGGQTIVQLLKRLVTCYPHSHIYQVRIGERELLDALRNIPSRNLIMVEKIPHHLMPSWYISSDVVIGQAALGILSLIELEAMSCGVPVVVYDKYYDYGYKTKSIESAWSMLENILSDTEFRRKLIEKGKRIIREKHEAGFVADLYLKYLASIRIR
jgi:glycosyltransferase involved in cell wall biosynthesis